LSGAVAGAAGLIPWRGWELWWPVSRRSGSRVARPATGAQPCPRRRWHHRGHRPAFGGRLEPGPGLVGWVLSSTHRLANLAGRGLARQRHPAVSGGGRASIHELLWGLLVVAAAGVETGRGGWLAHRHPLWPALGPGGERTCSGLALPTAPSRPARRRRPGRRRPAHRPGPALLPGPSLRRLFAWCALRSAPARVVRLVGWAELRLSCSRSSFHEALTGPLAAAGGDAGRFEACCRALRHAGACEPVKLNDSGGGRGQRPGKLAMLPRLLPVLVLVAMALEKEIKPGPACWPGSRFAATAAQCAAVLACLAPWWPTPWACAAGRACLAVGRRPPLLCLARWRSQSPGPGVAASAFAGPFLHWSCYLFGARVEVILLSFLG